MAQLDTTDPNNPKYAYNSDGLLVEGGASHDCAGDPACEARLVNKAQALLDAALAVAPEDE